MASKKKTVAFDIESSGGAPAGIARPFVSGFPGGRAWQLAPGLQLRTIATGTPLGADAGPAKLPPTHHVIALDCSGSMAGDMPALRKHLKEKLVTLVAEDDAVSIIWFSGRGECGFVVEAELVPGLRELARLQKTIDRWVKPIGLTGFVEPLGLAVRAIERVDTAARSGNKSAARMQHSFIFMSDGCDNQWSAGEIMNAAGKLSTLVQAATFVEYGYYADKLLLSKMAAKCSGKLVFARDFADYEPEFATAMGVHATPRRPLDVRATGSDVIINTLFSVTTDGVSTHEVGTDGIAMVPESATSVWFLASGDGGAPIDGAINIGTVLDSDGPASALYAALSVFATRGMPDIILPLLRALGDVYFVKRYTGLFGKQAYSEFQVETAAAACDRDRRLRDGFNPNAVPADDAFTVMDLLTLLQKNDEARILFDHPSFKYSRIGRKRVDATDGGVPQLKFVYEPSPDGTPCNALVLNEKRANVSINVIRRGHVDLSGRLPAGDGPEAVPLRFPSHQFRSYSIVADGLVNVARLPITADAETVKMLVEAEVPFERASVDAIVIKLDEMPIMDRHDASEVSAVSLLANQWKLEQLRCAQKVYKNYRDEFAPEKPDATFEAKYGPVAAKWLTEQGFSSSQGYAPPATKQVAPSGDYYMAKLVEVSIPGFGKLPTVKDAADGKGATAGAQMRVTIDECEAKKKEMDSKAFARWVEARAESTIMETRSLIAAIARTKFSVIVGQLWFPEFQTIGEGSIELDLGPVHKNKKVSVTFSMEEKKVEL